MKASEAVYGLLAWLTTRPQHIVLGSNCDAAPVASAAREFCETNALEACDDHWTDNLEVPNPGTIWHPSLPQKYLAIQEVTAAQITEETFQTNHPSAQHLKGVVYDPVAKTATVCGFTANCGDWIIQLRDGSMIVVADGQFQQQYYLTR